MLQLSGSTPTTRSPGTSRDVFFFFACPPRRLGLVDSSGLPPQAFSSPDLRHRAKTLEVRIDSRVIVITTRSKLTPTRAYSPGILPASPQHLQDILPPPVLPQRFVRFDEPTRIGTRGDEPYLLPHGVVYGKRRSAFVAGHRNVFEQSLGEEREYIVGSGCRIPQSVESCVVVEKILGNDQWRRPLVVAYKENRMSEHVVWRLWGGRDSEGGIRAAR